MARPADEWLTVEAPDLRIVPEQLWTAVQAQIAQRREAFGGHSTGPLALNHLPYLLSGLARCSVCRGPLISATRSNGNGRARVYQCSHHQKRGKSVCGNDIVLRQEVLDDALLDAVTRVLDARVIGAAIDEAVIRLRSGQEPHHDRRAQIERELSLIEARQDRLAEAVARGEGIDALLFQLRAEEERRKVLASELAGLATLDQVASLDVYGIKRELADRARNLRKQLGRRASVDTQNRPVVDT